MSKEKQKELTDIYNSLKKIPYSKKEPWMKFLDNDNGRMRRQRIRVSENEISFSSSYFIFDQGGDRDGKNKV